MTEVVQAGREAFARRSWADAYAQLSAADRTTQLGIDDLERLAVAAYLTGNDEVSEELWTRAHAECVRRAEVPRAVRCAFWLVLDLLTRGEVARAGGWLARAQRLLDQHGHDCPERGLILVLVARAQHVGRGDARVAEEAARRALELAERYRDPDLELFGRLIAAQVRAREGQAAEAVALFDELMAGVTAGDVSPIAVGVVYCAVIEGFQLLCEVERAREWTAALSRWCAEQPDMVPFRGRCLVHRVEVMRLSGAWPQAMREAERACHWLSRDAAPSDGAAAERHPSVFTHALGAAHYELGELHRVRGELAKAERAYVRASQCGHALEPGLALLRLAQGRPDAAAAAIRRALGESRAPLARATLLAAAVEVMIGVRDLAAARAAAAELAAMVTAVDTALLRALSAQAAAELRLEEGDARAAAPLLRVAWRAWQEIRAPYDAARVRVLLGRAFSALGDADAAALELDAARRSFAELGAVPDVARVNELAGACAPRGDLALTPRELQVIGLVATGRTNRAIAQTLGISERTVDRHVSNILMKLELPSRSAATAYAYEHGLV